MGKNILFGIGNGAEFRPQNRVIENPVYHEDSHLYKSRAFINFWKRPLAIIGIK